MVIRAGVMEAEAVRRSAERTFDRFAVYGISVEGVVGTSVLDACRNSQTLLVYRQVRLSTFGRLREAAFAVLATFEHPHFTVVLPDLSELTLARLDRVVDPPIPNPAGPPARYRRPRHDGGRPVTPRPDLWVDFMDMTKDRRLFSRLVDARPGFTPVEGGYAVVADDGSDPRAARILEIPDGLLALEVLHGPVEQHRDLLARA